MKGESVAKKAPKKPEVKYRKDVDRLMSMSNRNLLESWVMMFGQCDRDYFECFKYVWVTLECPSVNKKFWLSMFTAPRFQKREAVENWFMDKEERALFKKLPETVTVYRGCSVNKVSGISWTTDKEKAKWFAMRYNFQNKSGPLDKECCVVEGQIAKSDVLAVILQRQESEIICDPKNVKRKKKDILPAMDENGSVDSKESPKVAKVKKKAKAK